MNKRMTTLMVCGALVLGGCTGPSLNISSKGKFYNMESKSVGALDPSVKTLITFYCSLQEGHYEEVATEDGVARCDGRFVVLDVNQGKQTGYLTGVFSSAMQGAAFAGGMYLLGNGIGDSGSTTTNNNANDTKSNGGQTINSNANLNTSNSNAAAASMSKTKASSSSSSKAMGGMKHRR